MKHLVINILIVSLALAPVAAGVVYEIETTDHSVSPPRTHDSIVSVEGRHLKFDNVAGSGPRTTVIFRGDSREMVVVDHNKKSYFVMDQETLERMVEQLSQLQQQMEKQLAGLPKEQREMMEKMMKGRLPQAAPQRAPRQVRNTGRQATQNGYPCVRYEVEQSGKTVQELWVTDWDNVTGGAEVQEVFRDMASFYRKLLENSPMASAMTENPFSELDELEGFPVVTRSFEKEKLQYESNLRSSQRRTLDPAQFEPPAGYKRQSMPGAQ